MCVHVAVYAPGHAIDVVCVCVFTCMCVFYECVSSFFVIDGLIPYLSLRDPVLVR